MIDAFRNLFGSSSPEDAPRPSDTNLAAAALLIEVMVIDQQITREEQAAVKASLTRHLGVSVADVELLFEEARDEVSKATSLFQFTRQINEEFSPQQKFDLVAALWSVAFADGSVDKYEEHIIRRISELIHVPHLEFIRAKTTGAGKPS